MVASYTFFTKTTYTIHFSKAVKSVRIISVAGWDRHGKDHIYMLKVKDLILQPGRPKVAVPITGTSPDEIIKECEIAREQTPCDIIEWRADYYLSAIDDLDEKLKDKDTYLEMIKLLDDINYIAAGMPIIFTIRRKGQGGMVNINKAQNDSICELVAQSELVDFIDVELFDENDTFDEYSIREQIKEIHQYGCRAILSYHDFEHMPSPAEIVNIIKTMTNLGADVSKLAAMANSRTDAETLLKTTALLTRKGIGPIVTIAMGEWGKSTRIAAGRYGSCITFAAGKSQSAPGQIDAFAMKKWLDEYYGSESL